MRYSVLTGSFGIRYRTYMPAKKRTHYELTTAVVMSAHAESLILAVAREVRAIQQAGGVPRNSNEDWRYLPKGDFPIYPLIRSHWRTYIGGLLVFTKLADGGPARVVLLIPDARAAKAAWEYETGGVRRNCFLHYIDGQWFAHMKYDLREKKEQVRDASGGLYWRKRKPIRGTKRWAVAPPDWPRDKYGRPLSNWAVRMLQKSLEAQ